MFPNPILEEHHEVSFQSYPAWWPSMTSIIRFLQDLMLPESGNPKQGNMENSQDMIVLGSGFGNTDPTLSTNTSHQKIGLKSHDLDSIKTRVMSLMTLAHHKPAKMSFRVNLFLVKKTFKLKYQAKHCLFILMFVNLKEIRRGNWIKQAACLYPDSFSLIFSFRPTFRLTEHIWSRWSGWVVFLQDQSW